MNGTPTHEKLAPNKYAWKTGHDKVKRVSNMDRDELEQALCLCIEHIERLDELASEIGSVAGSMRLALRERR